MKNNWIIGASSGIGAALAKELSQKGQLVAVTARRNKKLTLVKQSLAGKGHFSTEIDVTNQASVLKATDRVFFHFKKIDRVFFMPAFYLPGKIKKFNADQIEKAVATNLTGAFYTVLAVLPYLKKQDFAQIILCSSIAGYFGLPNAQPYCATKAALISLAESLKIDLAPKIEVKIISPGFVKTELTDQNNFNMPFIMQPDQAAKIIFNQLDKKNFEIHFPKKLSLVAKLIKVMPYFLFFKIIKKFKA